MGIDWRAFAGYLVAGALVAGTRGGLYGGGVISAAAVTPCTRSPLRFK
jgi:hypothetical protein